MIRFVLSPDGVVTPDLKRRLPGRGVWIDARRESVEQAVRRRAFSRGFKADAKAADGLAEDVAALLKANALQRLAMAAKAGLVTCGFEKVKAAVGAGRVLGLVFASDAAGDGVAKLQALAKKACNLHNGDVLVKAFSAQELGSTLGRDRVVHVALAPGRPSELFFMDTGRWRAYALGGRPDATDAEQPDELLFAGPLTL